MHFVAISNLCATDYLQREELGALVSLEMGKVRTEGVGEVQEFVDIVSTFFNILQSKQFDSGLPYSAIMP